MTVAARALSSMTCSQATFADYLAAVELLAGRRSDAARGARAADPRLLARPGDRPVAVLPRDRHAHRRRAVRRGRRASRGSHGPRCSPGSSGSSQSERTSELKRRQGSITKAGSPHARRLLVEAAHHYRQQPAIGETLARRQAGQDPRVIEIAWRAQRRLHQRWQRLHDERRKPASVVAIAVARELAAFLWEAATLDLTRPPTIAPGTLPGRARAPRKAHAPSREARDLTMGSRSPAGRARS